MNINDILNIFSETLLAKKRFYAEVAQVVSVDEDNMSCEVSFISGNVNKDIRLGPVISTDDTAINGSNLVTLPKVDSFVMVTFINETTGFISLYSEVDKILRKVGDRYIQIDEDFIEVGGATDFMVRFSVMETAFNTLKTDFNNLIIAYNAHVHPGVTAGGASTSATPSTGSSSSADISGAKIDEVKTI